MEPDKHVDFKDMSPAAQKAVAGVVLADLGLIATAWHFLYHLPAGRIRGSKRAWFFATLSFDFVGPLAFLIFGIKR